VSTWAGRAAEYLRIRRMLGHELAEAVRLLPRFVAYLDHAGAEVITVEAALAWAQQPQARPGGKVQAVRMTVARGFARHMAGIDPRTQVPPLGLLPYRQRWRPPFIYSDADIQALMAQVPRVVRSPLRAATYQTLIGLLAATGMRVGEALRLERGQIDWAEGVVTVHATKFGKSREVPLAPSAVQALAAYAQARDQQFLQPKTPAFLVSTAGTPVAYPHFGAAFRRIVQASGVGAGSPVRPRVHDMRHSFAVHTLAGWYRAGEDVSALLPRLSTYLGHCDPVSTYWYLSAAPELLELAAARLQAGQEARP
jgi:integrase